MIIFRKPIVMPKNIFSWIFIIIGLIAIYKGVDMGWIENDTLTGTITGLCGCVSIVFGWATRD